MSSVQQQRRIDRHMTIQEILSSFPGKAQRIAQEITSAGLNCVGCGAASWETLEAGMLGHGMNESAIDALVQKLNAVLEQKDDLTTITLTPKAAKKFLEAAEADGKTGWSLRLEERMAGCSGFEYLLDFSEKAEEDDTCFESQGIQIHVRNSSVKHLRGCTIDFVDGLTNSGFKISNPNVRSSCGCGTSHGY